MLGEDIYVLVPGGRDRGWKDSVCTSASQGPGLSRLQRGASRQQKTELFCQRATCPGEMQEHGRGGKSFFTFLPRSGAQVQGPKGTQPCFGITSTEILGHWGQKPAWPTCASTQLSFLPPPSTWSWCSRQWQGHHRHILSHLNTPHHLHLGPGPKPGLEYFKTQLGV